MEYSGIAPFTIVIPLIPQHDFEIKRILKLLANEQNLIHQVIICRSESKGSMPKIEGKFQKYAQQAAFYKDIKVDCVKEVARDGTNRNRGWKRALSEYVVFIDADDLYSQNRLSVLLNLFVVNKPDAIVHNYSSEGFPSKIEKSQLPKASTVNTKIDKLGKACLIDESGIEIKVHFAHITVRNELRNNLMFTDKFPGADWEFAVGVVNSGSNMVYLNEELSAWSRKRSFRYMIRIYRMRLAKKLKILMSEKS
jgi:glycosyltransferase involved in cell wall biosynthesis